MALRSGFSSRLGFVAAASGSAVGLGNIWAFPYETGENGGAAFLLIYLLCTILIGFPIMVGEITVGRKAHANPYGAYKKLAGKSWGLVGLFGILCGIMILSFYNVVAGWAFGYFVQISFGDMLSLSDFAGFFGSYTADFGDNLIYSLVFMVLTALIVVGGVKQGIEMAAKILMPFLFIILFGLIIYAITLPNAMEGLAFYLKPDLSLISGKTIYSAIGQAFFSLSLGMGALITYGSYISKKENIISSAAIVTIADIMVAFLSGLLIFPLVFSQGLDPSGGPGLVFVVLPGVFQQIGPLMGKIVGGGFFLLLCMAALTSTISLLEVPVSYFVDEKKWPRKTVVFGLALVVFIIGLPSMLSQGAVDSLTNFLNYEGGTKSFLDFINDLFLTVSLPVGGLVLSLFVGYKLKTKAFSEEIEIGNTGYIGSGMQKFINLMLTVFCPIALAVVFVITVLQKFMGVTVF